MSSAARASDADFNAALFGGSRIFKEQIGGAVGGDDAGFMWNLEFGEGLGGKLHGVPVGAGTHDDADERVFNCAIAVFHATRGLCSYNFLFQCVRAPTQHKSHPKS